MEPESWLKDIFVFLAAAGLIVPLFHRARIGAVLGFLLIGVVVGPNGLGLLAPEHAWVRYLTIENRERAAILAEAGIMALLFLIGLDLSLPRLWSLRRYVAGVGGMQVIGSAALIGTVAAALGASGPAAVIIGLALAMSSTAMVMQLLDEQGRTATMLGRVALSVLLFQDLMVAPVLSFTRVLGSDSGEIAPALALAIVQGVAAILVIVVLGRFVLRPVLRFTGRTGSRDLIMAITVLIIAGVAGLTHIAGLSAALGAFLAGLLLSETEYRHQIEVDLEPFKGLLLGVFLVSIGMTIELRAVWDQLSWIFTAVVGLTLIKAGIQLTATRLFGIGWAVSAELALLLAQSGEFAFIIVGLARGSGILSPDLAQAITAVVGISMMTTPALAWLGRQLGSRSQPADYGRHPIEDDASRLLGHVVIGGFGRVGQMIARLLEDEHVSYIALDTDGELVARHRGSGKQIYFGDASRIEILDRVGAKNASAFVVTVNFLARGGAHGECRAQPPIGRCSIRAGGGRETCLSSGADGGTRCGAGGGRGEPAARCARA